MSASQPMTRRDFVIAASLAATGSIVHVRRVSAQQLQHTRLPATAFLPEVLLPDVLRRLAMTAIEAARAAGAQYADVRVAESQRLSIAVEGTHAVPDHGVELFPQFMYGIRTLVNGAWAFQHGTVASTDALAAAAREAVATARGYASINVHLDGIPQRSVVTGEWIGPCVLDPFTVPLMDQCALAAAYVSAVGRVRNGMPGWTCFSWQRETRVFAATDGSCVTQTFRRAEPRVSANVALDRVTYLSSLSMLPPASGGYECVSRPGLEEEIKRQTEEMAPWVWLPHRTLDVGRYPVVMDGRSVGITFVKTLGRAMELDRVVGHEMGGSGGSYLDSPSAMIGSHIASPLLTVTANRNVPTVAAARWDDDGVTTTEFPLIRDGTLMSYAMSCRSAEAISRGLSSNGCAVATVADNAVTVRLPHVTVSPSLARMPLRELYQDIRHGVYVHNAKYVSMDSTLASGFMNPPNTTLFEIRNGALVSILRGNALQFSTPRLWKSLEAFGDVTTVMASAEQMGKGLPKTSFLHTASAPAARFKTLDVINTGR